MTARLCNNLWREIHPHKGARIKTFGIPEFADYVHWYSSPQGARVKTYDARGDVRFWGYVLVPHKRHVLRRGTRASTYSSFSGIRPRKGCVLRPCVNFISAVGRRIRPRKGRVLRLGIEELALILPHMNSSPQGVRIKTLASTSDRKSVV